MCFFFTGLSQVLRQSGRQVLRRGIRKRVSGRRRLVGVGVVDARCRDVLTVRSALFLLHPRVHNATYAVFFDGYWTAVGQPYLVDI